MIWVIGVVIRKANTYTRIYLLYKYILVSQLLKAISLGVRLGITPQTVQWILISSFKAVHSWPKPLGFKGLEDFG